MMKYKMSTRALLYILFILLTAVNIIIYINRENGYEYIKQSSYTDLYPNISKGISVIKIEKEGAAVVDLKGYPANIQWNIYCNDSLIVRNESMPLHFTLEQHVNRYLLRATDSAITPITIDLDYSPAEIYAGSSSSIGTNYELRYCSEPLVTADSISVYKWRDPFDYMDPAEMKVIKEIITDSLSINTGDSTTLKIKKIGNYIYQAIKNNMGVPADSLAKYSVYRQFCLARSGNAKIWCGNITDIFHLFATNAGIICRNIGITGWKSGFSFGNHSMNECYIPETGEWAAVDITQNILLIKNKEGKLINAVNLYQLKNLHQTGSLEIYISGDSSIITGNYTDPYRKYLWKENNILFPHPYNPKTLYSFSTKLKRYFNEDPWLEIYSENITYANDKFYVKIFLFYSWLLLGLLILLLYFSSLIISGRNSNQQKRI
jgi:uncharacterized membrane protein